MLILETAAVSTEPQKAYTFKLLAYPASNIEKEQTN
jgi:hypothetical protein